MGYRVADNSASTVRVHNGIELIGLSDPKRVFCLRHSKNGV